MTTRLSFVMVGVLAFPALATATAWAADQLAYAYDGCRPLTSSEARSAIGAGVKCPGHDCTDNPMLNGVCPDNGPLNGRGCSGKTESQCATAQCWSCDAVGTVKYKQCWAPGTVCYRNNSGNVPCGNLTVDDCAWVTGVWTTVWYCRCFPPLPGTTDPCLESHCTSVP